MSAAATATTATAAAYAAQPTPMFQIENDDVVLIGFNKKTAVPITCARFLLAVNAQQFLVEIHPIGQFPPAITGKFTDIKGVSFPPAAAASPAPASAPPASIVVTDADIAEIQRLQRQRTAGMMHQQTMLLRAQQQAVQLEQQKKQAAALAKELAQRSIVSFEPASQWLTTTPPRQTTVPFNAGPDQDQKRRAFDDDDIQLMNVARKLDFEPNKMKRKYVRRDPTLIAFEKAFESEKQRQNEKRKREEDGETVMKMIADEKALELRRKEERERSEKLRKEEQERERGSTLIFTPTVNNSKKDTVATAAKTD